MVNLALEKQWFTFCLNKGRLKMTSDREGQITSQLIKVEIATMDKAQVKLKELAKYIRNNCLKDYA